MLQFRQALTFMRTKYPFFPAFGLVDTREQCVDNASKVFDRLMLRSPDRVELPFVSSLSFCVLVFWKQWCKFWLTLEYPRFTYRTLLPCWQKMRRTELIQTRQSFWSKSSVLIAKEIYPSWTLSSLLVRCIVGISSVWVGPFAVDAYSLCLKIVWLHLRFNL